ncbi:FHA domain-containing protein [Clostridium fungisolvens]|nr:FHA domain-containing protein [Clostridium fungisolvens]
MKRCEKGHFYDAKRTPTCPYCSGSSDSINLTAPLDSGTGEISKTRPLSESGSEISKTRPLGVNQHNNVVQGDREKTVALMKEAIGVDPVVGWLVCIEGADKGRDYRIHGERNFMGRSEKMDICIRGDETISRDTHAVISYDSRRNTFRLYQGDAKGIVYLNDEEVVTAVLLKPYDTIELGKSKLLFIPFCGELFKWE